MSTVSAHGELIAPASDVVIHGAIEFALGALGFLQLLLQHIENLVLQPVLPIAAGVLGLLGETLQIVGAQLHAAGFVALVAVIIRIKGFRDLGMRFCQGATLNAPRGPCFVGVRQTAACGEGCGFNALRPFGELRFGRAELLLDLRAEDTGQPSLTGMTGDQGFALLVFCTGDAILQFALFLMELRQSFIEAAHALHHAVELAFQHAQFLHRSFAFGRGQKLDGLIQHLRFLGRVGVAAQAAGAGWGAGVIQFPFATTMQPVAPVIAGATQPGEIALSFREFSLTQQSQAAQTFLTEREFFLRLEQRPQRRILQPAVLRERTLVVVELAGSLDRDKVSKPGIKEGAGSVMLGLKESRHRLCLRSALRDLQFVGVDERLISIADTLSLLPRRAEVFRQHGLPFSTDECLQQRPPGLRFRLHLDHTTECHRALAA